MEYDVGTLLQEAALKKLEDKTYSLLASDSSLFIKAGKDGEKSINPALIQIIKQAINFEVSLEKIADRIHQVAWNYYENDGIQISTPNGRNDNYIKFITAFVMAWKKT